LKHEYKVVVLDAHKQQMLLRQLHLKPAFQALHTTMSMQGKMQTASAHVYYAAGMCRHLHINSDDFTHKMQ